MTHDETATRLHTLQQRLAQAGAAAAIVTNKVNLYYLLGRIVEGYLFVPRQGDPIAFVKRPVGYTAPYGETLHIRKPEEMQPRLDALLAPGGTLLLEGDDLTANEYRRLSALFAGRPLGELTPLLRTQRAVKSDGEVELLRRSAEKQAAVYRQIPALYRPGMSDHQLFCEVEYRMRLAGHLGLFRGFGKSMEIFMGSVLAGDNAACPSPYDFALGGAGLHPSAPGGCDGKPIKEGGTVMVDVSGNFYGYQCDMSRTYSVGTLPHEAYEAHRLCLQVQRFVESNAAPGITGEELYDGAMQLVKASPFAGCFMGVAQKAAFIGHGIGLEINELPVLAPRQKMKLQKNMVFALEPKVTLPGVGPVGIENSWVVTDQGVEKLTLLEEAIVDLTQK